MAKLKPADAVIWAFGGVRETARAIGEDPATVCRWPKPRSKRGQDGLVPSKFHETVLSKIRDKSSDPKNRYRTRAQRITPEVLVIGLEVDDTELHAPLAESA